MMVVIVVMMIDDGGGDDDDDDDDVDDDDNYDSGDYLWRAGAYALTIHGRTIEEKGQLVKEVPYQLN